MQQVIVHLFSVWSAGMQYCYNVASTEPLSEEELLKLAAILGEWFSGEGISLASAVQEGVEIVEVGSRKNFATAWSTNFVSVCRAIGLGKVVRAERSRRYQLPSGTDRVAFIAAHHDRMTECEYADPLTSFETGILPEPAYLIPLMEEGPDAFLKFDGLNKLDAGERQFYHGYFVGAERRNPTIVEMTDLLNANSEHSRHGYFKGRQIIDGEVMSQTLMEVVQSPYRANPENSILAFGDNSSGVFGFDCWTLVPMHPGKPSWFLSQWMTYHIIATAETHNFPTGVAPFPGAETGAGGRIRDIQATGKGGIVGAGSAGYCVGNLQIPGYALPWENGDAVYPATLAGPLDIIIGASNGASDYGNKFGEPLIGGFTRSFGLRLPGGDRWEFLKPIMWTGGIGTIDVRHMTKSEAEQGMLIVQIGGPAYRIGFGGGAASSLMQGDNAAHLDFNAVQRGDGEMKRKVDCVLQTCVALGALNPVVSIHDQGAGGPANVLKELVEKVGGRIELRRIAVGDPTMSAVEIWVCEYQERNGLLISPDRIDAFKSICAREKVNCEVLGEVTGDGRFVVHDELDDSTPVDFELTRVLGGMPQKTFTDSRMPPMLQPLRLSEGATVAEALDRVLRLLDVCSKGFLVRKVDRSVGGLVARQQCCGPLQLPVADNAISALSHFGLSGSVTAIGEQPIKTLIDPTKGARMAVGEALTNMASALIGKLGDIKCSANWMWAAKLSGEGAAMWDAAAAMAELMTSLGIAPNRGKDSLSMATRVGDETVKSCRELVVYAYAPMPDITKHVTPDIKRPGESMLIHIDLANGKCRLGGSALAHVYGQLGDESPDVDDPEMLKRGFLVMQRLVSEGRIHSAHDIGDGGLIVTVLEMLFAGNCSARVVFEGSYGPIARLFAEELGWVVECSDDDADEIVDLCESYGISANIVGSTLIGDGIVQVFCDSEMVIETEMPILRQRWEDTSYQLERLQMNPECADEERRNGFRRSNPRYVVSFETAMPPSISGGSANWPRVAILREEGSNGYREMTSAFMLAGFEPWDVTMTDLLEGRASLDDFRGVVAVGGFSYADVPASAKGWAATIRFNPVLKEMFKRFYDRGDTFSLGVCNGCQLFALLGIVPWSGISDEEQPRLTHNDSGRFESRWSTVKILSSPSIMLSGMEGSVLGVWTAHGEGKFVFPHPTMLNAVIGQRLAPVRYTEDYGFEVESYPFNPNGSPCGIAALCTPDGRHLAMMPHPERAFLDWQWPWMPDELKSETGFSPWLQMFINARKWCEQAGK